MSRTKYPRNKTRQFPTTSVYSLFSTFEKSPSHECVVCTDPILPLNSRIRRTRTMAQTKYNATILQIHTAKCTFSTLWNYSLLNSIECPVHASGSYEIVFSLSVEYNQKHDSIQRRKEKTKNLTSSRSVVFFNLS